LAGLQGRCQINSRTGAGTTVLLALSLEPTPVGDDVRRL
jgi:hypothetical protein